ncbi:serine hydrolase domain-containing protein [Sunxiuqinia sp. sy24]|uniref:serine hydrolase domain-containing protein n=1 Tax=Sunxiuqinia sp. sy24 TaxID=3461495 RepID=UPI00404529E8
MKKIAFLIFAGVISHSVLSQEFLTAEESDPQKMGWMQGFPPPANRILSAADGRFFRFPALRYSACHMRQFLPTVTVPSAENKPYSFPVELDNKIDEVSFTPVGSEHEMTFKESLAKNYTDGIIIVHQGKIVYEKYFGALTASGVHAAMSVSKTFTGTLGGLLVAEGVLDENKLASDYVPELKSSAFGDATIRQILDMTTALQYSEDYADPNAEVWTFTAAGNPLPKPKDYSGPMNYFEFLQTVAKNGAHGQVFAYKTVNTDALGWIISRVTGKSIPDLLSERIWKPLGTQFDGYYQVDGAGIAFAGGGFNCNLRDIAMFGEMIRNNGFFNEQQILPLQLIEDIRNGGSQEAFQKSTHSQLKDWSYRNMWWITHNEHGAFTARGVHGQTVYVDPKAEMVLVRFASHPVAGNAANDPYSLPAYHRVATYLMRK